MIAHNGQKRQIAETLAARRERIAQKSRVHGFAGAVSLNEIAELKQEGIDLPLDALSDEECAKALYTLLT